MFEGYCNESRISLILVLSFNQQNSIFKTTEQQFENWEETCVDQTLKSFDSFWIDEGDEIQFNRFLTVY